MSQLRALVPLLLAIYVPTLLSLMLPVVMYELYGTRIRYLFLDPAASVGAPFYLGLFSQLGVLLWCATAAICLFTSFVLRWTGRRGDFVGLLLCFGLLTALFTLDDLFMLHEVVFPTYLYVPEPVVLGLYGALTLGCLARFRRTILKTEYGLLVVAMGLLGSSLTLDLLPFGRLYELVLEDGFKFMGIVTWNVYFVRTSLTLAISPTEALPSRL